MARGVTFTAGGKAYTLRYSYNALCRFEDVTGRPATSIVAVISSGSALALRALIWAGLKEADQGFTLDRAGQVIQAFIEDGNDFPLLGEKVEEALLLSGLIAKDADGAGEGTDEGNASPGTGSPASSEPGTASSA